ncbi:MAG: TraB/GumN family protein, partial [Novosphingobium sp.]
MFNRLITALLALLALASCARAPEVHPALWLVEGPKGEKAWLFGTIHALPAPVEWRSAKVDAALKGADRLVLEVADIVDDAKTAKAFAELAQSPGLPPLDARVQPDLRDDLAEDLAAGGLKSGSLDPYETWAAALMLQNAATAAAGESGSANGIDRAIALAWRGPIEELEGARTQLAIFDALPEADQRKLLDAVLIEADGREVQLRDLEQAWARGDMALIARVTDEDFAKAPALREALLVGRNRAWVSRLETLLAAGARPFVAVGAAHLA